MIYMINCVVIVNIAFMPLTEVNITFMPFRGLAVMNMAITVIIVEVPGVYNMPH